MFYENPEMRSISRSLSRPLTGSLTQPLGTSAKNLPRGALLVGSIPLANAEEVFRTVSTFLGDRLRCIPDGETGVRANWIAWQFPLLGSHPGLELLPPHAGSVAPRPKVHLRRRPGHTEPLYFEKLGYADAALESYKIFTRLKQEGVLLANHRFQISLPTPLAVTAFVLPEDREDFETAYATTLLYEVDRIANAIPNNELAIQWDVAVEFALLEGLFSVPPTYIPDLRTGIIERLVQLGESIPAEIELGYHLCYGDAHHQHFVQPIDASKLMDIANALAREVTRDINWIHIPIPRNRVDDLYYTPLRDLALSPETKLYLGLIHYTDGVEGAMRRINVARQFVEDFGVATECGMGRRPAESISTLLRIHADVSTPEIA